MWLVNNIFMHHYNYTDTIQEYYITVTRQLVFSYNVKDSKTNWAIKTDQTCWVLGEGTAGFPMKTWLRMILTDFSTKDFHKRCSMSIKQRYCFKCSSDMNYDKSQIKYPHDAFPRQVMLSPAIKISGHNRCCQHPSTSFFTLVPNVLPYSALILQFLSVFFFHIYWLRLC